uniref:GP3 protein n=1 Tax=Free State vervet virus TaxID=1737586 RepID=A0A162L8E7_9NIDO|nr:GP3 protein [Free State vervet virus]
MGHHSILAVLTFSSLLCSVYGYCFVFPDPNIHVQVFLNYTTCHMQGIISAGYQSLGGCHSFKHNEFSGTYSPLNLNYSTAAPVGAVILGLSLLNNSHRNCSWTGNRYCCAEYSQPSLSLQEQPLPHLILLSGTALLSGIMSVCLVARRRYTTYLV